MNAKRWIRRAALLSCGAIPLVTTVDCDPITGTLGVYRNDNADYYWGYDYGYGYDEVYIVEDYDCGWFFDCW